MLTVRDMPLLKTAMHLAANSVLSEDDVRDDPAMILVRAEQLRALALLQRLLTTPVRGTQVIYRPTHADRVDHPDCERGFVTSVKFDAHGHWYTAFCRFWLRDGSGLRTLANSELAYRENLILYNSVDQLLVDTMLEELYE